MLKEFGYPIRYGWHRHRVAQGCPHNREHGSELIEFAFVALILCCVLFGMLELTLGLYSLHFVAEAAQLATRFAQVRGSGCQGLTACPAQTSDITTYVQGLPHPGINPNLITVNTVYSPYPAGSSCTPSATCNNPGNLVTVTVAYTFTLNAVPLLPTKSLNFTSTAAAVISE
jgi:Flp pilus assembly protein TadG